METKAEKLVRELRKNGILRTKEILDIGISKEYLRKLTARGVLEKVSRGFYRLSNDEYSAMQSLAEVSKQIPKGVICCLLCGFMGLQR